MCKNNVIARCENTRHCDVPKRPVIARSPKGDEAIYINNNTSFTDTLYMKKLISLVAVLFFCTSIFAADLTASFITSEAAKKDSVDESVTYLKLRFLK